MKKPAIGLLDLGASGGRVFVAVTDRETLRLVEIHRFENKIQYFWQKDSITGRVVKRACWNLGGIFEGMLNGLGKIAASGEYKLVSFGIDTWGSDGTWVNSSGDMLGIADAGRDERFEQARKEIFRCITDKELFDLTGVQSYRFNVLNQIYWHCKNRPNLLKEAATYMPIHSLLYYFLTGEKIAEYTWMSTTQTCSAGKVKYCEEIFDRLDLPIEKMPKLVMPGDTIGYCLKEVAYQIGLEPFKVIVPAVHDTSCAYAAAPVKKDGTSIILSSGTWFMPGLLLSEPLISSSAFEHGYSNEAGIGNTRFLKSLMGSWPIQQLRNLWQNQSKEFISYDSLMRLALESEPLKCLLDIDDAVFLTPENMEDAIREYCNKTGQRPPVSRGDFIRACYEGLAIKIACTVRELETITGQEYEEIVILGGGSQDTLLCQLIADAAFLPVRTGQVEATVAGNALVQAMSLGWIPDLEEGRNSMNENFHKNVYIPNPQCDWQSALNKIKIMC